MVWCLQALQPQLDALEAQWFRLHTLTGAATPEEVLAFWDGALPLALARFRPALTAISAAFVVKLLQGP